MILLYGLTGDISLVPDVSVELVVNTIEGIYPALTLRVFIHFEYLNKNTASSLYGMRCLYLFV